MAATISSSSTYLSISSCLPLHHQTTSFHVFPSTTPHLGHALHSPWNGLKHIGQKFITIERREKRKSKVVHASLFGVGAPEALVIGVVALLVFGPKGLAEVARNLGQTLRAFQPTIRELQDVSREFKSTLEREIGLDDIPSSMPSTTRRTPPTAVSDNENTQSALDPNADQLTNKPYSTEEYLKTTEEQLKAMAAQQQVTTQEPENQSEFQDGAPPAEKPFSLGEVLVEAQERSTLAQQQEQTPPQEPQTELETEPEPQPKEATPTVTPPTTSESEK